MKKRILSFALALFLICSLSINAFAASDSRTDSTTGGSIGRLNTSASLSVNKYTANATTWCSLPSEVAMNTTLNYTFVNDYNHLQTDSNTGTNTITMGNNVGLGQKATSSHTVNGGSEWGGLDLPSLRECIKEFICSQFSDFRDTLNLTIA